MNVSERIRALRENMGDLDAWYVPGTDPHQSEYLPDRWQERKFITGFSGSAGTVVITRQHAGLWTDSRYFIQAEKELQGSGVELFKLGEPGVPQPHEWLKQTFPGECRIGFDGRLISVDRYRTFKRALDQAQFTTDKNLLDQIWTDRPNLPEGPVVDYPLCFAGEDRKSKLERIREKMTDRGADHYFLASLDDIAWAFNLRGEDVQCIPIFISFALINLTEARLYILPGKIAPDVEARLAADGVQVFPYDMVEEHLDTLPDKSVFLVDPQRTGYHYTGLMSRHGRLIENLSIVTSLKAIKNEAEIAGMRRSHERHGVAMVKFFHWLVTEGPGHTEWEVSEKLESFRIGADYYRGPSFTSIVGYNPNGALPHYSPKPDTALTLGNEGMVVVDTGGQYLDGTIDMTRTVVLGEPTEQQINDYTAVLKAHLGVAMMEFIHGTNGVQIDAVCRKAMWKQGLSFGHGTGHGVGCYLSVHEGPQSISPRSVEPAFVPGMITSNEPGVYREGEYGIRIENLVLVEPSRKTKFGEFYHFETITLLPFDRRLIDVRMLTSEEIDWIDDYHRETYRRLSPHLEANDREWLAEQTRELV